VRRNYAVVKHYGKLYHTHDEKKMKMECFYNEGRITVNLLPFPKIEETVIDPPWTSAIVFAIASPKP